jgi:hypothetical protein
MMNLKNKKKLLAAGVTLAIGLTSFAAYADVIDEYIDAVVKKNFTIKFNGEKVTPRDGSGKEVYPVVINGTTYLPVRAISNMLELNVGWDGGTNTISMTSKDYVPMNDDGSLQEVELNGDRENANPFPLDKTMKGYINGETAQGKDSSDYYKIEIPSEGYLKLTLNGTEAQNPYLYLYGIGSSARMESDSNGIKAQRIINKPLLKGTYFVEVKASKGGEYKLINEFSALKEQTEANNTREEAYQIKLGQTVHGISQSVDSSSKTDKVDMYKIVIDQEMESNKEIQIILEATEKINPKLYLYKETSSARLEMDSNGIKAKREITTRLEAGTYYIDVQTSEEGDYTLSVN